jgi:glycosyltransferase involved in cell wall biosynthesis
VGAARALGIPVSSSFHTNFHTYAADYGIAVLRPIAVSWLRWVHNRTLCTFAPTDELCNELSQLGFANLRLLSRGVDTTLFSPSQRSAELRARWGAGPDDPVVVHPGRMAAEKNYPLPFRIYEAMRTANPRCRFVLVGDGPLREALQRRHPEFRFVGFVPREELARHYASADIYVHASLTETFGNVVTEALASGLAVTGFDYAAARQFIRQGVSGLTVPRSAPDALTDATVALATSTALRDRLRSHARATVLSQSSDHVITLFESDLHGLNDKPPAARPHPTPTPPPRIELAPEAAN